MKDDRLIEIANKHKIDIDELLIEYRLGFNIERKVRPGEFITNINTIILGNLSADKKFYSDLNLDE